LIQLDPLLDEAPCGFMAFEDDGTLHAVNATLLRMTGYTREELAGSRVERLMGVGSRIFYQTHFFPLLRLHGRADEIFLLLRSKGGEDVAVLVNAQRRARNGAHLTECVCMQVVERRKFEEALLRAKRAAEEATRELEVSQQKLEEQAVELEAQSEELRTINEDLLDRSEELERLRVMAEDANGAKSSFLAMMSHELRTPLNAIGGYVQLMEMGIHGPVTEAQHAALDRISRAQVHLLRLVNEVLNLARIESGRVEYDITTVTLREVVETVEPMVAPQLAERRLRFEISVPAGLSARADREKLEQVLLNLLSNATKFTEPRGLVRVDAGEDPDSHARVFLRVQDTGCGIPAERLAQVFDPFVQVNMSRAGRAEGTGLGLTISRDLAQGMGGDLTVSSEEGVGSVFTIFLARG
jgi:PAS domain S-box-containing protein